MKREREKKHPLEPYSESQTKCGNKERKENQIQAVNDKMLFTQRLNYEIGRTIKLISITVHSQRLTK